MIIVFFPRIRIDHTLLSEHSCKLSLNNSPIYFFHCTTPHTSYIFITAVSLLPLHVISSLL